MKKVLHVLLALAVVFGSALPIMADDVKLMKTDQLKSNLGSDDIVVIDVRAPWDWAKTDDKIAGAVRQDPQAVNRWAEEYPKSKTIVLYCA